MRNKMHKNTMRPDQRGVVSFMVTLIMMLVISLIVIGFTQVTMRSRREALDKQLSSQAFYAAESGVNKAIDDIISAQSVGSIANKDTCADDSNYTAPTLDGSNVAVTCVMVDTNPSSIVGSASQSGSFVAYIYPVNANGSGSPALNTLTFSWSPANGQTPQANGCTGVVGQFPASVPATCAFGLLRVDLFQFANVNTNPLDGNATTALYLQPLNSGGVATISSMNADSHIVSAKCDTQKCQATIDMSAMASTKQYYARLSSLYRDVPSFKITGDLVSGGASHFKDSQIVIDSTGRAQDVLRRVQVRYPLKSSDMTPPWAAAGKVCKRLNVIPAALPATPYSVANDDMCN